MIIWKFNMMIYHIYGKCPKICTQEFLTQLHMQTVQTQIKLLLKEQSDQGLHCLPFHQVY